MKTKTCDYSECNKTFEYKNPKQRFCSLRCKNEAAYNYRQTEYKWEVEMQKARRKNIQILEYLMNNKILKVILEELKKMGFDFGVAMIPFKNNLSQSVFRYGNIGMTIISKTECELFQIKTN